MGHSCQMEHIHSHEKHEQAQLHDADEYESITDVSCTDHRIELAQLIEFRFLVRNGWKEENSANHENKTSGYPQPSLMICAQNTTKVTVSTLNKKSILKRAKSILILNNMDRSIG